MRRSRCSRGAAVVELALVFPVLVLLLAGLIDFALVLSDLNSQRHGTREGARSAVVNFTGGSPSCTVTVGTGVTLDPDTHQLMCLTKRRIGLSESEVRMRVAYPATNEVGNSVVVCAMYPTRSVTGLLEPMMAGRVLKTKAEMRIEKVDDAHRIEAGSELALTGESWTWCA